MGIFSYIERENPKAAVHVDEEIAKLFVVSLAFPKAVGLAFYVFCMAPRCGLSSSATSRRNYDAFLAVGGIPVAKIAATARQS